ncbi:serine hydrolase family protein [Staphylococcus simiae]|uniref:RBBP9/YdeN family alpha/beta hydrolase n=1 Tax=Staphylococcus simiae TaxID=308354 RepID=UPI001A978814|nr:alpha/beta hydrolase [Staphylococcus simiae]MBO1199204.1 serine hydrolase family protein [Staphylococcus simiae]MBO1201393.1 serine hydrolase family protein [Staphylococcus simiae]MBO1203553.1 serine hydrolase family protein [Staphylococcus simiae]MBO1211176.1 serine hydrolase family protein [Staphylococcus simiae]MBO1229743.1 serine hydrolase family protein [Staphylococcus simiae]
MTDVIIVHSMYGDSHNHWYQWLQHNLTLEGYNVTLFNCESAANKTVNQWVEEMKKQIHITKQDTYFVTHGLGSITSLKYIELLDHHIEGFFSIAGFKEDAEDIDLNVDLRDVTIDYDNIKAKVDHFYGLSSKNDKYVSYKETQRLMNALEGNLRIVEEGGHFLEQDGFKTFTTLQDRMQGYMTR